MNSLHLSLLILAVLVLGALFWIGRSKSGGSEGRLRRQTPPTPGRGAEADEGSDQMDLWKTDASGFDELGVGQPRTRGTPRLDPILTGDAAAGTPPPASKPAPPRAEPAAEAPKMDKIVAFYIAEREGTYIHGDQIHKALRAAGLRYSEKMKVYERLAGDQSVFGVAGLLKPGHLDPAEARQFSTPGLSMFMVLPGPLPALKAFDDFLKTGRSLASALNAELYDTRRAPLDENLAAEQRAELSQWAAEHE